MSHGDAYQGKDWPRRLHLVILALTSLMVVAGIVTAAYRGKLFRPSIGWGAITLTFWMSFYWWYSLRRSARTPVALWIVLPLFSLSASYWLMAVAR